MPLSKGDENIDRLYYITSLLYFLSIRYFNCQPNILMEATYGR